jgi:hypothetical protein
MGEQPAQPLEDLNPQASPRRAGGTPGAEAPLDGRDQRGAGRKRDGIDQERDGGAQREQQAAGRWADEVLAHGPSTIELAVRALQAVAGAGDQRWDERRATLSNSVWPVPRRNPTAASSGMVAQPASTATPRTPTTTTRQASTRHITRRRSHRSTSAPLISPNSNHGSQPAKVTSDTCSGSRLSDAASSGRAARNIPSPAVEMAAAPHNRW